MRQGLGAILFQGDAASPFFLLAHDYNKHYNERQAKYEGNSLFFKGILRFLRVDMQRFGQQLKTFRQQRGLTQLDLAQRAGVPQPLISDLEAGKREGVTLEMAWRLARTLSVSLDHLAGTWEGAAEVALGDLGAPGPPASGVSRRGRPRKPAPAGA